MQESLLAGKFGKLASAVELRAHSLERKRKQTFRVAEDWGRMQPETGAEQQTAQKELPDRWTGEEETNAEANGSSHTFCYVLVNRE